MTSFEYISTLLSIIIGLGITHLFVGISRLINNPRKLKIYWIHLLWTLFIFLYLISFWWFEFKFNTIQDWTFQLYLFIILYAVLLFFLCVINMPFHFPDNFKENFYSSRKWFFTVLLIIHIIDIFDTILKGSDNIASLGIGYIIHILIYIILTIVAIFARKEIVHGIIVIVFNIYIIWYLLAELSTLSS